MSRSGTIEWQIKPWSSLPVDHVIGDGQAGQTCSEVMQAGGDKWKISVRPGGKSKASDTEAEVRRHKEHVAIALHYVGDSEALRAKYSITLVNQLPGKADLTGYDGEIPITFGQVNSETVSKSHGFADSIMRSELEDEWNGWKMADRVIIRATITTFDENVESLCVAAGCDPCSSHNSVAIDLKAMLDSGYASDIILRVGHTAREFPVHKLILGMRSPLFKALFASSMHDAPGAIVEIADTEHDVFAELLTWIYTGEVSAGALEATDMPGRLLVAATGHECMALAKICEAKLCEGLTVENVATRLVVADQTEADTLKQSCLDFISGRVEAVMQTEGIQQVKSAGFELLSEVTALLAGGGVTTGSKKRTAGEAGLSMQDQDPEVEEMHALKIARLREALQERGLDTKGRRPELVARLERVIREKKAA